MKLPRWLFLPSLSTVTWPVQAASTAAVESSASAALMQALLGLVVVLGVLYGFFWILRRFSPAQAGVQGLVKVVGGVMLSPRERLVVVEIQGTWLLLGVASGNVSLVHSLPKPEGMESSVQSGMPPFADKLADLLRRPKG